MLGCGLSKACAAVASKVSGRILGKVVKGAGAVLGRKAAAKQGSQAGYRSFRAYKRAMGPAGPDKEWHHIVNQTKGNVARFGPHAIHNANNMVALDTAVHRRVSAFYSSKNFNITGSHTMRVRDYVQQMSFDDQQAFGMKVIQNIQDGTW